VELTVDPRSDTFDGWMRIDVELRSPAAVVWLNAKDLTIQSASFIFPGEARRTGVVSAGGEFLGLQLDREAGPGPATLDIHYQGRLDEKALAGPYRRKVAGDWYVYTTFTPIDARRAFPCFDEPRFKTPWDISIRVKPDHQAFSNGREISESEEPDGWKRVRFATTPPLAAEVVAFAVGPFDVYQGRAAGHATPIRVITPKGRSEEGRAAAEATSAVLPRLEAYTGIPYPFEKLDHLALAEGAFGAMENPGLITYRAERLLVPPGRETPAATRAIRALEAHEIGHQWFGNLVTQADWRDVWLSEGFATWIEAKVMDQEQPPQRAHLAAIAARERIMAVDISSKTRPVRLAAASRQAAGDVYNRLVYDKGASVLMMLEAWLDEGKLGEDKFRNGVRSYLMSHAWGAAAAQDLAAALHENSGIDPSRVLHSFLDTTGVPTVSSAVECDQKGAKLEIRQSGASAIPVCWRTDTGAASCTELDSPSRFVDLAACPRWVYLNSGGTGYYRTTWTAAQLRAFSDRGLAALTPAERLTLVFDLRAQQADRSAAHAMLKKLTADAEPEIARAARTALNPPPTGH
jgi:alanyl aminopeptidase